MPSGPSRVRSRLDGEAPARLVVERHDLSAHLGSLRDRARPARAPGGRRSRRARSSSTRRPRSSKPVITAPEARGSPNARAISRLSSEWSLFMWRSTALHRALVERSRSLRQRTRARRARPGRALRLRGTIIGGGHEGRTGATSRHGDLVGLTALALAVSGCAPESSVVDRHARRRWMLRCPKRSARQLEASVTHAMAAAGATGAIVGRVGAVERNVGDGPRHRIDTDSDTRRHRHGLPGRRRDAADDLRRALRARRRGCRRAR